MPCKSILAAQRSTAPFKRRGITLIELLVAILIVIMLASMVLFALQRAQVSARQARTQALVARLHSIISRQWATYQTRRVPVQIPAGTQPSTASTIRLAAIRQLMRLELPDKWADVTSAPDLQVDVNGDGDSLDPGERIPQALNRIYQNYHDTVGPDIYHQNAECLYMIITIGLPLERELVATFSEAEVGDVDGDGAKEFLDAWGTPIGFLRWPVGFVDYPNNPEFGHLSDLQPPRESASPCRPDATEAHDPLDPRQADPLAFTVFPLVYSAGPDKLYDIYAGGNNAVIDDPYIDYRTANSCAAYDPLADAPTYVGIPVDRDNNGAAGNGSLDHQDNIHNHFSEARVE